MKFSNYRYLLLPLVVFALASSGTNANENDKRIDTEYYSVQGDKVDADTFKGYSAYHQACVRCHGVAGVGSDDAPDLTESAARLSPASFRIKVLHRFAIKFSTDDWTNLEQSMFEEIRKQEQRENRELTTMPRWENNPMVEANVQNIYRYLKARSDGAIDTEKPGIIKD